MSEQRLYQVVYEQWLHADLTDVTSEPSLPTLNGDKGTVSGNFIAQVRMCCLIVVLFLYTMA